MKLFFITLNDVCLEVSQFAHLLSLDVFLITYTCI